MASPPLEKLPRREREIMEAIFALGDSASVEDVRARLSDPPSYSAVRAMLRILEEKGHVRHEQDGPRYVYLPTIGRDRAKKTALRHVLQTFFNGSTEQALSALLDESDTRLSDHELERLAQLIDRARRTGA